MYPTIREITSTSVGFMSISARDRVLLTQTVGLRFGSGPLFVEPAFVAPRYIYLGGGNVWRERGSVGGYIIIRGMAFRALGAENFSSESA